MIVPLFCLTLFCSPPPAPVCPPTVNTCHTTVYPPKRVRFRP